MAEHISLLLLAVAVIVVAMAVDRRAGIPAAAFATLAVIAECFPGLLN